VEDGIREGDPGEHGAHADADFAVLDLDVALTAEVGDLPAGE
jgi:hypothetical protein